nr:hypothetical protein [Tanacetum cinerariifolium]
SLVLNPSRVPYTGMARSNAATLVVGRGKSHTISVIVGRGCHKSSWRGGDAVERARGPGVVLKRRFLEQEHVAKSFAMLNNVDKGRKTRVKSINGVHDQVFVTYVAAKVFKTVRHGSNIGSSDHLMSNHLSYLSTSLKYHSMNVVALKQLYQLVAFHEWE